MILNICIQITEIRQYAERNCRKIRTPDSKFSPTVRMWYERIHAHLQLIWMREGKVKSARNILRFGDATISQMKIG